ncbi:hypothetical protein [Leptolyngbya sp. 7M]|nr:hypothetical protein [Leptolyngbya sp. 7M]QYO64533.1 hypothetical protein JVX88_33555 [Leptolyngbya sp. 7M]
MKEGCDGKSRGTKIRKELPVIGTSSDTQQCADRGDRREGPLHVRPQ